ncbi:hypothetical protein SeMB42_g05511 [Synchytrium endobioticum]|uniref:BTB domain-containing protein n=1 Tax=Synchytrium endobioticum TaxID=286115 RepID=A0A507CR19_9FUNG|nr:hypothetical protein SeLEV6574_g07256 [Synchytrium endobioticum]TPX41584.1 hypothetical protein SeMB42_g05511 [Synchytrium endobioticum]
MRVHSPKVLLQNLPLSIMFDPIYKEFDSGSGYISIFLKSHMLAKKLSHESVHIDFAIAVKIKGGNGDAVRRDGEHIFTHGSDGYGWREFMLLRKVKDALQDDVLTIEVEARFAGLQSILPSPVHITDLYDNAEFADVTIDTCGAGQIAAHALVLKHASAFFRQVLLRNDSNGASPSRVALRYSKQCVTSLLQYVYGKERSHWMPTSKNGYDQRRELLMASDYCQLEYLYKEVEKEIICHDFQKRVLDLLSFSDKCPRNEYSLKKASLVYITKNYKNVLKSEKFKEWKANGNNKDHAFEILDAIAAATSAEYEDTNNKLVKVCRGCQDVDLKWCHQNCIDQFIAKLPPTPMSPRLPAQMGVLVEDKYGEHLLLNQRRQILTDTTVADAVTHMLSRKN